MAEAKKRHPAVSNAPAKKAAAAPTVYALDCVGLMSTGVAVRIHKHGCKNVAKEVKESGHNQAAEEQHTSLESVVDAWFSDIIAENDGSTWQDYANEVAFCACVPVMPLTEADAKVGKLPAKVEKAARKTPAASSDKAKLKWRGDIAEAAGEEVGRRVPQADGTFDAVVKVKGKDETLATGVSTARAYAIVVAFYHRGERPAAKKAVAS
jgi:hypothetical protein